MNLQYIDQIHEIMMRSGQLVMQSFKGSFEIFEKKDGSLATSVDRDNELFLKRELARVVPQAGFVGEEYGSFDHQADYTWVIDPLDGTKNFIKGIPHFCIMISLTYKNEPIVGAIYLPVTGELYYAEKNKGLWLGDTQIKFIDQLHENKSAIVICSDEQMRKLKPHLHGKNVHVSKRYFGSAGIDAIYVATGSIDFVMFDNVGWWDVAAGMLLILEAGGLICQYNRSDKKWGYGTLKAGNKVFF